MTVIKRAKYPTHKDEAAGSEVDVIEERVEDRFELINNSICNLNS